MLKIDLRLVIKSVISAQIDDDCRIVDQRDVLARDTVGKSQDKHIGISIGDRGWSHFHEQVVSRPGQRAVANRSTCEAA